MGPESDYLEPCKKKKSCQPWHRDAVQPVWLNWCFPGFQESLSHKIKWRETGKAPNADLCPHTHAHMCAHSSEPIHTHQQQQKNPNSNRRVLTSSGMRSVSRRDCGSHFDIYTSTHAVLLYTFSYVQCYLAINPGPGEEAYKVCCIFPYFIPRFLSSDLSCPLQPLPLLQSWSLPPPRVTLRLPCSFLSTYNILWAQLLCLSLGSLPRPSGLSAALKAA